MLDSTKAYKKLVTDKGTLDGVPESALALFAQGAKNDGHPDATDEQGPWLLTLVSMRLLPIKIKKKVRPTLEALPDALLEYLVFRISSRAVQSIMILASLGRIAIIDVAAR